MLAQHCWVGGIIVNLPIGLVSICGCCTMRVGQRKLRPEVSVSSEEYKKQFQTSKELKKEIRMVPR